MAPGTLGIAIGDVAGHGFGPTLLMASLRAHLRGLVERFERLDELVTHANRLLSAEMDDDYFITLLLGRRLRQDPGPGNGPTMPGGNRVERDPSSP